MFSILAIVTLAAAPFSADDVVVLSYYDRPPYMVSQPDGGATGLTADPAVALFERAGIPYRWQMTPAKRQLSQVKEGTGHDCGIGWFKTAERARFAEFIGPLYHDRPAVILAGPGFPFDPARPVEQTLAEVKTLVLVKDGLTYGSYVTKLISRAQLNTSLVTVEQAQMVNMVVAGRAEADLLSARWLIPAETIRIIELTGDPTGDDRYLMCSRKMNPRILEALKDAQGE